MKQLKMPIRTGNLWGQCKRCELTFDRKSRRVSLCEDCFKQMVKKRNQTIIQIVSLKGGGRNEEIK